MTALLFLAAIVAGAIAALAGFGIGSVLTPLLALSVGTKEAVVAVSIPIWLQPPYASGTCGTILTATFSRTLVLPAPQEDSWVR